MVRRYPDEVDWTLQRHPVWRTLLIALMGFLALAAWAISSPAGSSPDDDFHLTSIWCAQGERAGLCENVTEKSVNVPNDVVHAPCFAYHKEVTAACQSDLGTAMFNMGRANILEHSYPGGFYWVMSWFAGPNVQISVILMRLFNAALFVATATVTFLLIERRWRAPLALGLAITAVPLAMSIIPSTNPSSWTLYAPAFIFLLVRSMLSETNNRSRIAFIAVTTVAISLMASSARSDAAVYAIFAVALASLYHWRTAFKSWSLWLVAAPVAAIALWSVLAGKQSSAASSGLGDATTVAARSSIGLVFRNLAELPRLYAETFTGNLGWLDTPMPGIVWVGTLVAFIGVTFTAIAFRKKSEFTPILVSAVACAIVPLLVAQRSGAALGTFVQSRYVFPLLVLLVLSILAATSSRILLNVRQLLIAVVSVCLANFIALLVNMARYSAGLNTSALFSTLAWSPPGGALCPLIVGATATIGLGFFALEPRSDLRSAPYYV